MTLIPPPTDLAYDLGMSNLPDEPEENDSLRRVDTVDLKITTRSQDIEDEYSDFAEDPEELELIDQLLLEVAAKQTQGQNAPLVVTDIEDYEGPRSLRLPKVFGVEKTREWAVQEHIPEPSVAEDIRDPGGKRMQPSHAFLY